MTTLAFLGDVGGGEVLVIFAAILILFGSKRLPEIARSIGRTLEELRRASENFRDQIMKADESLDDDRPKDLQQAGRTIPFGANPPPGAFPPPLDSSVPSLLGCPPPSEPARPAEPAAGAVTPAALPPAESAPPPPQAAQDKKGPHDFAG